MKKLFCVKLHETWCLYFPFLFYSFFMQSFFSFPALSFFGTQQQLTHPLVKCSTLPLRKMPVFQGVAPCHTIFTSSCVITLWDSATAHPPSDKELNPSSFNQSCFSGLIVVWCSHIILTGLSLFRCSPMLLIKPYMHLYYFILSVVYFYSERPPLSKYFILCVVCFYSERSALLQRSVARDFGGVSQFYFFYRKNSTKQCFGLPKEWSLITPPLLQWYMNL